ncbi:4-hydroxy-3-methylbut-2-enyl diphosphate reductase [Ensifer adhaerens]
MKVIIAQPQGFCAGVTRAIDTVKRALELFGAPIYVYHEIVHNPHVVKSLEAEGAVFVERIEAVPEAARVIFSAHGVGQTIEASATRRHQHIIDATCPLVSKVHAQGQRYAADGRTVVLIGHAGHQEVIGTLDRINGPVRLIQSVADVERLDLLQDHPLAYITQTTLSVDDSRQIINALEQRFTNLVGPDISGICYATQNRQTAVRELCKQVDLVLVVGATNSSNCRRLQEIAISEGLPSHLLADGSELDFEWLHGAQVIGLTAGASTPKTSVDDVLDKLRKFSPIDISTMPGRRENAIFSLPAELENPRK